MKTNPLRVLKNDAGIGLVNVMVGIAFFGVLFAGLSQAFLASQRMQAGAMKVSNLNSLATEIQGLFQREGDLCTANMPDYFLQPAVSVYNEETKMREFPMKLHLRSRNMVIAGDNWAFPNDIRDIDGWHVKKISVTDVSNFRDPNNLQAGWSSANLEIIFTREVNTQSNTGTNDSSMGSKYEVLRFPLVLSVDVAGMGRECFSVAGFNKYQQSRYRLLSLVEEIRNQFQRTQAGVNMCGTGTGSFITVHPYVVSTPANNQYWGYPVKIKLNRSVSALSNSNLTPITFSDPLVGSSNYIIDGWKPIELRFTEVSTYVYPNGHKESNLYLKFMRDNNVNLIEEFRIPAIINPIATVVNGSLSKFECYNTIQEQLASEVCRDMGGTYDGEAATIKCTGIKSSTTPTVAMCRAGAVIEITGTSSCTGTGSTCTNSKINNNSITCSSVYNNHNSQTGLCTQYAGTSTTTAYPFKCPTGTTMHWLGGNPFGAAPPPGTQSIRDIVGRNLLGDKWQYCCL